MPAKATKYVRKSSGKSAKYDPPKEVVTVKQVTKDTIIESERYGKILVTEGNYILKAKDGTETGITEVDLNAQYEPTKD